jgi:hypothetical protein
MLHVVQVIIFDTTDIGLLDSLCDGACRMQNAARMS